MKIDLAEEPIALAAELARIPIAFEVNCVLEVTTPETGPDQFLLSERRLDVPYIKDYDTIEGENPTQWANRFDVSHWGLVGAHSNGSRIGAAVIAFNTGGIDQLEGRSDLALLWNIRVLPHARRRGVGSALFRTAEAWASAKGCRQLKVETQNINAPACRFYARLGCVLSRIDRFAYPEFPGEIQLLWYKDLTSRDHLPPPNQV